MTQQSETEVRAQLVDERLSRIERAIAELAGNTYGISTVEQVAGGGKPALASLLRDHRSGMLETADAAGLEVRS